MSEVLHVSEAGELKVGVGGSTPITASIDAHGEGFVELARLDGRYFSSEVAAGYTGRMLALGSPRRDGRILSIADRSHTTS